MVGAGLLPVALHKGCIYLLFGRENELNDTPGWADFGGGTKPNESIIDAAAREGSEELNGLLGSQSEMKKIAIKKKIAELKFDSILRLSLKLIMTRDWRNITGIIISFSRNTCHLRRKTRKTGCLKKRK
jgi:hypothetical protein